MNSDTPASVPKHSPAKEPKTLRNGLSLKKIPELRQQDEYIVAFMDEVHFQQQSTTTVAWHKKGSKPRLKSYPGKAKVAYAGFITPETGALFVDKSRDFTAETIIQSIRNFLKTFNESDSRTIILVMDNAAWHKKACRLIREDTSGEYSDISSKITFLFLPPYSPDLNPIERVWRVTRRENTHNRFFKSISELESKLDTAFKTWSKPNAQLRTLCANI
ncbi:MAG: IS630 family transposase [Clostridia bacterium]|nr:IS630 family transposase [Clostridia bacterium]